MVSNNIYGIKRTNFFSLFLIQQNSFSLVFEFDDYIT